MFHLKTTYFFILITCGFSFAQVKDSINHLDKKGLKQGNWIKKDEKGIMVYSGIFVNDKPSGKFTYYFPTGKVKSITTFYKQNQAFTQFFNTTGKKMLQGKVIGELKDSTWTYYGDNDSVSAIENYLNGKRNGVFKTYFKNGKVLEEVNYKMDVLNGPYKQYFDTGVLRMEYVHGNGLRDGKAKFYYPSGQMSVEGIYNKDFKEGIWNFYSASGSMDWQVVYKKSNEIKTKRFNGIEEDTYSSKMPKSKVTYKNAMKNGLFTEYYDAGTMKQEVLPAKEGYPEETKEVPTDQKIKRKGSYLNDKLDGKIIYYKLDGTIEKEETYKEGLLVKF